MKPCFRHIAVFCCLLLCWSGTCEVVAQSNPLGYQIEKGQIVFRVSKKEKPERLDSLLALVGTRLSKMDSLCRLKAPVLDKGGWYLNKCKGQEYVFKKSMKAYQVVDPAKIKDLCLDPEVQEIPVMSRSFGKNRFRRNSVRSQGEMVTFSYWGGENARQVYLTGSFAQWSIQAHVMTWTGDHWEVSIPLKNGAHQYKFIVDGRWTVDPENLQIWTDPKKGYVNSVFFQTNHLFRLPGYPHAKTVSVAGTFNDWIPGEIELESTPNGWELPVYLHNGTYSYRFVVDGQWMADPGNSRSEPNGFGEFNSVIRIGEPNAFVLAGYPEAQSVIVSGDFNDWNEEELSMSQVDGVWKLYYSLPPGNYHYKFLVDGRWITDPDNPHSSGQEGFRNSFLCVGANTTLGLKGHSDAEQVLVSGTFNNWDPYGISLERKAQGWVIDLYLPSGKTLYKFVVDGVWMFDAKNPLWEENEYGSRNSLLWVP